MDDEETFQLTDRGKLDVAKMLSLLYKHEHYDITTTAGLWEAASFLRASGEFDNYTVDELAFMLVFGVDAWKMLISNQE